MRIALMCATRRGYLFLQKLSQLAPSAELFVFSFAEDPWEPPFLEDIRTFTLAQGGVFFETRRAHDPRFADFWAHTPLDLMFAVSWRYLVPPAVYRRPRMGTYVLHDSLLPAYRGFSPTVWAIINGEEYTGATLFRIAQGVDEGDIIDQEKVPIGGDETIATVMERVTGAYLALLERNLEALLAGRARAIPQDGIKASYTCKRLPEDNHIVWSQPGRHIHNLIRAVTAPYPGAYTFVDGRKMIVWSARQLPGARTYVGSIPGRVVEVREGEGSVVLTGDGSILLEQVQFEGEDIVCAASVLNRISLTLE